MAASRPLLLQAPLGTGSASFAGGGAGYSSGLNSVFGNPATLAIRDEFQVETGMMGMAAGFSPYFLFGSRAAAKSSYAMGYFHDARAGNPEDPAPPRQGIIAGVSWEALPWAVFGASAQSVGTG
ncbi:MAG: hypothetical protein M3Y08_14255, partial [Fibrobacterota bacterium]|nr:hypothetical protein [Fibrobacterota bacterium]